jgi:pimeloyl-ACP methyl ester carboxylesterase
MDGRDHRKTGIAARRQVLGARHLAAITAPTTITVPTTIVAPTTIIVGADGPATPPSHAELIAAAIASAKLHVGLDAAHRARGEQPAVITHLGD